MLQDAHTMKINLPVIGVIGTVDVVDALPDAWIYIHELIGDLAAAGTLTIRTGLQQVGFFQLDAGQGITLSDIAGEDNRPRFQCKPGEAFTLQVTGGPFNGSISYSIRY